MDARSARRSSLPAVRTRPASGAEIALPYKDYDEYLARAREERHEEAERRKRGEPSKHERFVQTMMNSQSTSATWRQETLLSMQQGQIEARLRLQKTLCDPSALVTRELLTTQQRAKRMMFRLSDTKSPVNGREREAPETISSWQNAGFAAAETRVEGFRASGKARTQKSHPHWASQHMASIVRQIGTQRRKETEIAEGMERDIMAYEERRQRETNLALLRAQECSDFVDFLVLVNRYGPVPDWQVFAFGRERFGRLPGRRYQRRVLRAARCIQNSWNAHWSVWRPRCMRLACNVQRLYRGHRGRKRAATRRSLLARVDATFKQLERTLMCITFQSWLVYCKRSLRVKMLMRRVGNRVVWKAFASLAAFVRDRREVREARLRLYLARIVLERQARIMIQWRNAARRDRAVRDFAVRIMSGVKLRVFEAWFDFTLASQSVRAKMVVWVARDYCKQGVMRILGCRAMQRAIRGHCGRKRACWRREDLALRERQRARAILCAEDSARRARLDAETAQRLSTAVATSTQEVVIQLGALQRARNRTSPLSPVFEVMVASRREARRHEVSFWVRMTTRSRVVRQEVARRLRVELLTALKLGYQVALEDKMVGHSLLSAPGLKLMQLWARGEFNDNSPLAGLLPACEDLHEWKYARDHFPLRLHAWAVSQKGTGGEWFGALPQSALGGLVCVGCVWKQLLEALRSALSEHRVEQARWAWLWAEVACVDASKVLQHVE